jgi:hypothetical protein
LAKPSAYFSRATKLHALKNKYKDYIAKTMIKAEDGESPGIL